MRRPEATSRGVATPACRVVVIWIDWYAYHLARFEGLQQALGRDGEVRGIEMVGGIGVHAGLKFREDRAAGLPIETLLPETSWSNANKVALARALWRRLNELRPEVVLVPGYYTLPAVAAAVWARVHRRVSVLMTESTAADHVRLGWKERIKSMLIRTLFDWAVVGGTAHARYVRALGMPADRIVRFYDVVGNDAIQASTERLRRTSSREEQQLPRRFFLFVGRLAPEKNVAGLLRAWLEYRRRGGDWQLVLAGDGPEAAMLKSLLEGSSSATDVVFAGLKSAQQLYPLFAFASAFVLPSTREPWGLVVNEAMAAGLPVIVSSRCGCTEDLVESGRNGLVFDPVPRKTEDPMQPDGDHAAETELAACLEQVAGLGEAERAAMGRRSAEIIAAYSPRNFGLQIALIARARGNDRATQAKPRPEPAA